MRARLLLAVCALCLPARASAEMRVMCYGDSITAVGDVLHPEDSYPGQLQRLRPDLEVVNEGRAGDVSANLDRFRTALADWPPQLVVLMLGTNDPACDPARTPSCEPSTTPERTVANLFRMADEARRSGTAVVILTPTPAVCQAACRAQREAEFGMAVRQAFTARVAEELLHARPPAGVRVADLRGRFTDTSWEALSVDGLHPATEGNRVIAEFVAAQIPKRGAPHDAVPGRHAAGREADPFARQPGHQPPPR
jgi:lysophospholipase L1-like esterase